MNEIIVINPPEDRTLVTSPNNLEPAIKEFLTQYEASPKSLETYRRQLKQFVNWVRDNAPEAMDMQFLSRNTIRDFRDELKATKSPYSVNGYLTAVRIFWKYVSFKASEAGHLVVDIFYGVKGAKRPKGHAKDELTAKQVTAVLQSIKDDSELIDIDRLRNFAMFNLMVRTGLRDVEVSRAQIKHIRRVDGQLVLYVWGKGRDSADEFVILTDEAYQPVQKYVKARGQMIDDAPVFASSSKRNYGASMTPRSISRIIKNCLVKAGFDEKRLTAHSLRHTAVTLSLKGGASLQQAQAMARHASADTTLTYAHNLDRVQDGAERYISLDEAERKSKSVPREEHEAVVLSLSLEIQELKQQIARMEN